MQSQQQETNKTLTALVQHLISQNNMTDTLPTNMASTQQTLIYTQTQDTDADMTTNDSTNLGKRSFVGNNPNRCMSML